MLEILVFLILGLIAVFAVLAKWSRQPYPIVFLLGGIALALIPGMPTVQLAPDLVFLVFLPPLIFGDGFVTDWRDFRRYIRPITLLATALVVATSVSVAYVAHWLIGLPLAVGFVLGAILSPTDTVATDAIAEETELPRRIEVILSGESLVNDATALVLFKFAVGAVLAGSFTFGVVIAQFAYVATAGIAVGVIGSMAITRISGFLYRRGLTDDTTAVVISLVSPYLLYVAANQLQASGVLAAAAGGIYFSRKGSNFYTPDARIIGVGVWNTMFFLFNGALFIILGLQLRTIVRELDIFPATTLAVDGGAVALTVIVVRVVWVFIVARARRFFDRGIEAREGPTPPLSWTFVLGWAGMRGIVSLAAALAIPDEVAPGVPFPARDLIQFITFVTILVTLIGQGITLPWFIRIFKVHDVETSDRMADLARLRIAEAGLRRLQSLEPSFASSMHWEIAGKLRQRYEEAVSHGQLHVDATSDMKLEEHRHALTRDMFHTVLAAERAALVEMRHRGDVSDQLFRRLQWDIDLEESLVR